MSNLPISLIRILDEMEKKNISKKEMCARLGYEGQQAFASWMKEDGKNTSYIKKIPAMADILDVSADYLLGKTDDPRSTLEKSGMKVKEVGERAMRPIIGMASAGRGVLAQEEVLGWESVDIQYSSDDYFYLEITGDSMAPRIEDGDLVLVHRQVDIDSGDVAVVLVNDGISTEGFVKKIELDETGVVLHSYNPYYPPMVFSGTNAQQVSFVGKVIELKRKF